MSKHEDLSRYFGAIADSRYAGLEQHGINLLDRTQSAELTDALSYHPYVQEFGGIVLDDPGTSEHHLYLTQPPLAGSVFLLSHEGASRVVFPSLEAFLLAVEEARASAAWLADLHPPSPPPAPDQAALGHCIDTLLRRASDTTELLVALIPSLDLRDTALLERLLAQEDFFIAEAVAMAIENRPDAALAETAQRCLHHAHPQVAAAGRRAANAIRKARHSQRS